MNNKHWNRITSFLLPNLRGTHVSGSGNIHIKLNTDNPSPSRSRHKKPSRLRVGTRQYSILKWIWQAGEEGRRYTDIQLWILGGDERVAKGTSSRKEMGWDWNTGRRKEVLRNPQRGHYATWLSWMMPNFCSKNEKGNWVLTDPELITHFESTES